MPIRGALLLSFFLCGLAFSSAACQDSPQYQIPQHKTPPRLRQKQRPGPVGPALPAPHITSFSPVDVDGFPLVEFGQTMSIKGTFFIGAKSEIDIVITPPDVSVAYGLPDQSIAEFNPNLATETSLEAVAPELPASGIFLVWVVTANGWSNPIRVYFRQPLPPCPQPVISPGASGYPSLSTTISGHGFQPDARVLFWPLDNVVQSSFVQTTYVSDSELKITVPAYTPAGIYGIMVYERCAVSHEGNLKVDQPVPLNLYSTSRDASNIVLNPKWGLQLIFHPNESGYYPKISETGALLPIKLESPTGFPPVSCTQQLTWNNSDVCCCHHNWFPVTYQGAIEWHGHDPQFPLGDDDYNFLLYPTDGAGSTSSLSHYIKLEFDSDETVDDMTTTWWDTFHHLVDSEVFSLLTTGKDPAIDAVQNKPAIVTGVFGVDCAHDCDSEVHPVYAMTINIDGSDPLRDTWATFVRNWGNEGYCGSNDLQVVFPSSRYIVRVPWRENATTAEVTLFDFWRKKYVPVHVTYQVVQDDGVYVSFDMPDPSFHPLAWGTMVVKWTGTNVKPTNILPLFPRPSIVPNSSELTAENMFRSLLNNADATKRNAFLRVARPLVQVHPKRAATKISPRFLSSTTRLELRAVGTVRLKSVTNQTRRQRDLRVRDAFIQNGIITPAEADVLRSKGKFPKRGAQPK